MARSNGAVIGSRKENADRLPDWASEGSLLVEWMRRRGVVGEIGERLRIQREGGYAGVDLLLFLLFFLTSQVGGGIKGFGERAARFRERLGALGGRRRIPTPASVSRILAAAEGTHSDVLSEWLLFEGCDAAPILGHAAVMTRDANGEGWHVFDLDPTTTVLRQRALPDHRDLPPPRRRSAQARAGYSGRKRGDVQFSRMTLQHAGSSLWMGLWMAPGNGDWREHSEAAACRVRSICNRMNHTTDRALVRVDGAGGNVPFLTACQEAGIRCLTRWSRYEILDEADVRAHLNAAQWSVVADSGSGPRREAADIGWMVVHASESTVRDDGAPYAPLRVRVVVSRFPARQADSKRGAGTLIDGWQYELYATTVEADSWPAEDVVTAYYGRCGLENRFYQEDQDVGLDHIFSYEVAGQQLANLIGLFLWNLRVCRGFALAAVPAAIPPQTGRVVEHAGQKALLSVAPEPPCSPADSSTLSSPPDALSDQVIDGPIIDSINSSAPAESSQPPAASSAVGETVQELLNQLMWPDFLKARPGWHWDSRRGLTCTSGQVHQLQSIKIPGLDTTRQLRFLAPNLACLGCTTRSQCTSSQNPLFRKETAITVPSAVAYPIHVMHEAAHRRAPPPPPAPIAKPPPRRPRPSKRALPTATPLPPAPRAPQWDRVMKQPGPYAVVAPMLLPAKLRQLLRRAHQDLGIHVRVCVPACHSTACYLALTPAERQSRRSTWPERLRWNALPDATDVRISFLGGDEARRLLTEHPRKLPHQRRV